MPGKSQITSSIVALSVALAAGGCATSETPGPSRLVSPPQAQDPYFRAAQTRLAETPDAARARNVILFIGDGMGVTTITAARIMAGQRKGVDGESYTLAMDTFPHTALSRTYSHDRQVSDSAATATAMTAGVKTRSGVVGLTSEQPLGQCAGADANRAETLFEMAERVGMATGVVSTARITHATPAAVYAHSAHRDWESDAQIESAGAAGCVDIARQLIEWPAGDGLEVALGGGRANFLSLSGRDPEDASQRGQRRDGRDLTAEWRAKSPAHRFVWNAAQFKGLDFDSDVKVLGLFSPSHMAYENDRAKDVGGEPSLAEMTSAAIRRLSRSTDGYVLMVEGGRVDHAHHEGKAGQALSETIALDDAVRTALSMTNRSDTLILVTADHSHVMTIAGYASRNAPITGLSKDEESGKTAKAGDGLPYTTLGYANGPGSVYAKGPADKRPDLSGVDTQDPAFRQQALVPLGSETHGGEDVALYAWGPGDTAVAGTIEQNTIFHIMARALGFEAK
jgi:alkaline phosphatase